MDEHDEDYDPTTDPDYDWSDPEVTADKLEALKLERQVLDIDYKKQALNILEAAAPAAASRARPTRRRCAPRCGPPWRSSTARTWRPGCGSSTAAR